MNNDLLVKAAQDSLKSMVLLGLHILIVCFIAKLLSFSPITTIIVFLISCYFTALFHRYFYLVSVELNKHVDK